MSENIKEKEINEINMQDFLEKCKTGEIDEENIPEEMLPVFEKLYAKRKEREDSTKNEDIKEGAAGYIDGLTIDDIKYINDKAIEQSEKYSGEKFDMKNVTHREYFEYFKHQLLKEKEREIKIKQFEEGLHEKYGEMFEQVENAAINAFENMAYKDARNIITSRMKGDIETLITFYDNIYNGLLDDKKESESVNDTVKNTVLFPPKSIKAGNNLNKQQKSAGYENFI